VKKAGAFTFQLTREGIEARLGEMEKKMDRLRSMYESFFMGMERIPPDTARREMNRMMLEMQQVSIVASSLRFRFQSLSQKWVLQSTYWNRTMREIEAGTFRRDVARTQRHLAERGGVITEEEALALGIPKSRVKAFVARHRVIAQKKSSGEPAIVPGPAAPRAAKPDVPTTPSLAAAAPPAAAEPAPAQEVPSAKPSAVPPPLPPRFSPPPIPAFARRSPLPDSQAVFAAPSLAGVADRDFEGAFQRYLQAHRELGIEAQAIPKETMRQRLGKQLPRILQEKGCDRLRLEVAVEGGKVRMRAWPDENKS
jgi:hypothetical protein